jgi:hypothetical protein
VPRCAVPRCAVPRRSRGHAAVLRGTRPRGSIGVGLIVWCSPQYRAAAPRRTRAPCSQRSPSPAAPVRACLSECLRARASLCTYVRACVCGCSCVRAVMVVCACLDGRGDAHVLRHVRPRVSEARVGDRVVEVEARDQRRRALWVAQRCAAMSDIKRGEVIRHSRGRAGTCAALRCVFALVCVCARAFALPVRRRCTSP